MKNKTFNKTLIFGVLSGLICAACVMAYVVLVEQEAQDARNEAMARYGGEQVEVVVAKRDVYPGETLDSSNTTTKLWLADLLPESSVLDTSNAWGRKTASYIVSGEVIVEKRFESSSLGIDVPEGLVAVSVPTKDVQAVGGAITPGSVVDVYAVGTKTTCLGHSIAVLATSAGDDTSSQSSVSWITLAVAPEKTQEFIAASESMEIYCALPAAKKDASAESENVDVGTSAAESDSGQSAEDVGKESKDAENNSKEATQ